MLSEYIQLFPIIISVLCLLLLFIDAYQKKESSEIVMGICMVVLFLLNFSNYAYGRYSFLYQYLDIINQYSVLLLFPLFHVYIRMLCVKHTVKFGYLWKLFLLPHIWLVLYIIGVILLPNVDYMMMLYSFDILHSIKSTALLYVNILLIVRDIIYIFTALWVIAANIRMVNKYYKAHEIYSNMYISSSSRIKVFNNSIIIVFVFFYLSMQPNIWSFQLWRFWIACLFIAVLQIFFTYLAMQQRAVQPIEEPLEEIDDATAKTQSEEKITIQNQQWKEQIQQLFIEEKIYTDANLDLYMLANRVGTNRNYLSKYFNDELGVNFCSYINKYRIEELKRVLIAHPEYSVEILTDLCGFGSVDSLKRAVQKIEQQKYSEWRKCLLTKKTEETI